MSLRDLFELLFLFLTRRQEGASEILVKPFQNPWHDVKAL